MKEVFSSSSSLMWIWLYPEKASIKLRSSCPEVESIRTSIRGRGKLSFGHVLFRSEVETILSSTCCKGAYRVPFEKVLQKPDLSGRLVNWAVELGEFDLEFCPRTTIKAQVLADFIAEFSNLPESKEMPDKEAWVAYVDGASMKSRSRARVALITPDKEEIAVALNLDFPTTNNEAEYEAIIAGLSLAEHLGAKNLEIRSDSQVVVGHIQ
jgi:hypothetical protein